MSKKGALMCGHGRSVDGSWDCGTSYGGSTEAGLMLPITKSAVKYLRSYGVKVISDADTNNDKNMIVDVRWANKEGVDVYVSVHCDYYKAPSGVMPLYVSTNGKKLATCLNNAVKSGMGMKSRGVIRRTDLWELNGTDAVACILETGSIKADIKTLKGNTDAYGKCIAKGVCDYLGIKAEAPAPTTKELYRVRKSWNEPATQKGAFSNLENAKLCADVNHLNVYASNGKLVYQSKQPTSKGTKIAKQAIAYCGTKSTEKPSYKAAAKEVYGSGNDFYCHRFVGVVLRKCGYPKMDYSGKTAAAWKKIFAYLNKNFKKVSGSVKAGDIHVTQNSKGAYHIFIEIGNGRKAEANSKKKYYPHQATTSKGAKNWIYRAK